MVPKVCPCPDPSDLDNLGVRSPEVLGLPPREERTDVMRKFDSGATRNVDATKPDYEGFLSPLAIVGFGRYMNKNRVQADGKLRDSDNWQKGIPPASYMKSLLRHVLDLWLHHRGFQELTTEGIDDAVYGAMFNIQGYAHEKEKSRL